MFFIIGGQSQGKLKYALEVSKFDLKDVINCETDRIINIFEYKIIYNFHIYIRKLLEMNINALESVKQHIKKESKKIIICNEIGCGIVPIDKQERIYRDELGKICIYLAKISDRVERVCCGIPIKIKG